MRVFRRPVRIGADLGGRSVVRGGAAGVGGPVKVTRAEWLSEAHAWLERLQAWNRAHRKGITEGYGEQREIAARMALRCRARAREGK